MRFPFLSPYSGEGQPVFMPFVPISLNNKGTNANALALLDTGAMVNVLPYQLGLQLGCIWDNQKVALKLGGNLASSEARAVFLDITIEDLPSRQLAFAWSRSESAPLLLGQTNFFMEFDVFFSRSNLFFDISPKNI
jgi:hypothetical protein